MFLIIFLMNQVAGWVSFKVISNRCKILQIITSDKLGRANIWRFFFKTDLKQFLLIIQKVAVYFIKWLTAHFICLCSRIVSICDPEQDQQ